MAEIVQETLNPVSFAGGVLDRYRHVCAFINSRDEEQRIFDPFVTEGIERGEKVVYFIDPEERANLVRHVGRLGFDVPALLRQGQLELQPWRKVHLHDGRFDDAVLVQLDELLGGSPSPRLRIISDMGWAVDQPGVSDRLVEIPSASELCRGDLRPRPAYCVYNTAKFGGDVVIDMLRTES